MGKRSLLSLRAHRRLYVMIVAASIGEAGRPTSVGGHAVHRGMVSVLHHRS